MAINILVIDDDVKIVERLMRNLKRADSSNIIGDIKVDDSFIKLESIEKYDVAHFGIKFDVALIDYQLCCSFTGILVSAWISLYLGIPRLTLTTATYPGESDYFNGFILKNEITDSPNIIITRIVDCIDNHNSKLWLEKQHHTLVQQYQILLNSSNENSNLSSELSAINVLLDQFEKILDTQQEVEIKKKMQFAQDKTDFITKENANLEKLQKLGEQLDSYLKELSKYD